MSAASIIREARDLIAPKGKWTQDAIARDADGNEVAPRNPKADRFCLIGALQRVGVTTNEYSDAVYLLRQQCRPQSIFEFNDTHGKRQVLALMDSAAESAEAVAA